MYVANNAATKPKGKKYYRLKESCFSNIIEVEAFLIHPFQNWTDSVAQKEGHRDFPGCPVDKTAQFHCRGSWVRFLVR